MRAMSMDSDACREGENNQPAVPERRFIRGWKISEDTDLSVHSTQFACAQCSEWQGRHPVRSIASFEVVGVRMLRTFGDHKTAGPLPFSTHGRAPVSARGDLGGVRGGVHGQSPYRCQPARTLLLTLR
jgi:hypothetical protein